MKNFLPVFLLFITIISFSSSSSNNATQGSSSKKHTLKPITQVTCPDYGEPNETIATASPFQYFGSRFAIVSAGAPNRYQDTNNPYLYYDSQDYYKFTTAVSGTIRLEITGTPGPPYGPNSVCYPILLYNGDGDYINSTGSYGSLTLDTPNQPAGTYYALVSGYISTPTKLCYTLRMYVL